MKDGLTQRLKTPATDVEARDVPEDLSAKIVAMSGRNAGVEYRLERSRVTVGRGPGVDLAFEDSAMSRQHAAFDFVDGGFRLMDLGSTNGLRVNGNRVHQRDLQNGDRIEIGTLVFQLVIDERDDEPEVYDLTSES